jgi:hypothetical protein
MLSISVLVGKQKLFFRSDTCTSGNGQKKLLMDLNCVSVQVGLEKSLINEAELYRWDCTEMYWLCTASKQVQIRWARITHTTKKLYWKIFGLPNGAGVYKSDERASQKLVSAALRVKVR